MNAICRIGCCFLAGMALCVSAANAQSPQEQKLFDLINAARADTGLKALTWDAGLATAAHVHAQRMADVGTLSHQYDGEPDVAARSSAAGARFSMIEENIAIGDTPKQIQDAWMRSQVHHDNLLNPSMDRIGVALVPAHGTLFAVADFTTVVASKGPEQVEAEVGKMLQGRGLTLKTDNAGARKYCESEEGEAAASLGLKARFLMRWQGSDLSKMPPELEQRVASGDFKQAEVGACAAHADSGSGGPVFSVYRVAVLLY